MSKERIKPKYPPKNKGGAKLKLTSEVIKQVTQSLMIGNYFETAMASAGFHKDTGYDWLKKGAKNPKSIYGQFSDAVRKAEADSETRDVMLLDMAAHGAKAVFDEFGNKIRDEIPRDPKIAQWRLERKFPKRWARLTRIGDEEADNTGHVKTFVDLIRELEKEDDDENDSSGGDSSSSG